MAPGLQTEEVTAAAVADTPSSRNSMAEIHVEPRRRSMAWLWILLVIIIAALVIYYFGYYRTA